MPQAGRLTDIGSGHGCFPPSPTIQGSGDVFINVLPALRKGDAVLPHGCGQCPPHGRNVSAGSATVNINNKPAARVGDAISCGGSVATGSANVIIGDASYGAGAGEAAPAVRFVVSQVPGSTEHGYFKEPYKLYHNGSLVQEGLTDENGVISFEPEAVTGTFEIEAVNRKWVLTAQALPPADSDAGVEERLKALGYHVSDESQVASLGVPEATPLALGWFQNARAEDKEQSASDVVKRLLKALIP